jgi:Tol biopolymer transport system component
VTLPPRDGKSDVRIGSLEGGMGSVIATTTTGAVYAPPGYLIYSREESIVAQPFDESKLGLTGEPRAISSFTLRSYYICASLVSASANEILVEQHSSDRLNHIVKFDREGHAAAVMPFPPQSFGAMRISPDANSAAVEIVSPGSPLNNTWTLDFARGTSTRQTSSSGGDNFPIWSPDGRKIVVAEDQVNTRNFLIKSVESAAPPEMLLRTGAIYAEATDWSSDGAYIVFTKQDSLTNRDIWILPMVGNKPPYPFVQTRALEAVGKFSPDVHWLLYISDESGRFELYVQSFPSGGIRKQVSTKGMGYFWGPIGTLVAWRHDGKELYFLDADNRTVMAADFKSGDVPVVGTPRPLFKLPEGCYSADPTADGKFFYANVTADERTVRGLDVVLNWPALVREK